MRKDNERLCRIMVEFEQKSVFSTNDPIDAYHVALLKDRGFVDAEVTYGKVGTPETALIHRITATGYEALEEERAGGKLATADWHDDNWLMAYWKDLLRIAFEAQSFHDHFVSTVSTGAIALAFVVARELKWKSVSDVSALWMCAVASWVFALIFVLISCHTATYKSQKCSQFIAAGHRELSDAFSQKFTWTWWLNILSSVVLVAGIGFFGWFIMIYRSELNI